MTDHPSIDQLNDAVRALPRSIAPPVDLWPDIRAAIEERHVAGSTSGDRGASWRRGLSLAAAAVVLVALTAVTTAHLVRSKDRPPTGSGTQARRIPSTADLLGVPTPLTVIDRSYQPTLSELATVLAASRDKLAPATVARVERNLQVIDAAIAELRDALSHDPNNSALAQILSASYRQKVDLLRRVSEWVPTS